MSAKIPGMVQGYHILAYSLTVAKIIASRTQVGLKERTCRPSRTGLPGPGTGASLVTSLRITPISLRTV